MLLTCSRGVSHLVTTVEPPPTFPHPAAIHINYCIGAEGLLIGEGLATVPHDPDQAIDLLTCQVFDTQGQEVDVLEVFDWWGELSRTCSERSPDMLEGPKG